MKKSNKSGHVSRKPGKQLEVRIF